MRPDVLIALSTDMSGGLYVCDVSVMQPTSNLVVRSGACLAMATVLLHTVPHVDKLTLADE